MHDLKLYQVGLPYCTGLISTYNELSKVYSWTINSKNVETPPLPSLRFVLFSFMELYPAFNVLLLYLLSIAPLVGPRLSLEKMILDNVHEDFKLSPSTCHTLVMGWETLTVLLAFCVCFSFSFRFFCVRAFDFSDNREALWFYIYVVDDLLFLRFCPCWRLDRCHGTWKTHRSATFMACIDVWALCLPSPRSSTLKSSPVTLNPSTPL